MSVKIRLQRHGKKGKPFYWVVAADARSKRETLRPARHSAGLPAEHHRFHGRPQVRKWRHRPRRCQDGDSSRHRQGTEIHRRHRRLVRCRQLRHVRSRLLAALPVDVAECAHFGDGWRSGSGGAGDGQARWHRSQGRFVEFRRRSGFQGADS